jgi:hypothetical protein
MKSFHKSTVERSVVAGGCWRMGCWGRLGRVARVGGVWPIERGVAWGQYVFNIQVFNTEEPGRRNVNPFQTGEGLELDSGMQSCTRHLWCRWATVFCSTK